MGIKTPKWIPLKEDVDKILETSNERELFVVGQIVIERILEKVIEAEFHIPEKILDDSRFPMQLKMDLVTESELLEEKLRENIKKINSIRNRYGHRLEVDQKSVENLLFQLHYLETTPEIELEKFDKYRICVKQTFNELEKILRR
jgi:hypothetical protein